jgi:hypothetical protein
MGDAKELSAGGAISLACPELDGVVSANLGALRVRMSSDYINNPEHWQARAAEMRAIAGPMAEDGIKASMLRMATDYDKLAARAIRRGAKGDSGG